MFSLPHEIFISVFSVVILAVDKLKYGWEALSSHLSLIKGFMAHQVSFFLFISKDKPFQKTVAMYPLSLKLATLYFPLQ